MFNEVPAVVLCRRISLVISLCSVLLYAASLSAGDKLRRAEGRTRTGTAVDETLYFIHWRADGAACVEKVLKDGKVRVEYAVPLSKIRECNPTRRPEKGFALALEWLGTTDPSAQYHGRKLLWLTMHQHEDGYYMKGCLALLDHIMMPRAQREWLLRSALRKHPEDRALMKALLRMTGPVGQGSSQSTKPPAKTAEIESSPEEDSSEPLIIDHHSASDSRAYRALELELSTRSEKVPLLYQGSFPKDIDFSRPNYTGSQWSRN
jgi:hypothetical protein